MRILVTGGLGFIGSNFIRHILKRRGDVEVVNVDAMRYGSNPENLKDLEGDERYVFVKGDITDYELMSNLVKDVDVVVNFAAESVSEDEVLFVRTDGGIRLTTFGELFEYLSKECEVESDGFHEVVEVGERRVEVLSYLNGRCGWCRVKRVIRHWYEGKMLRLIQGKGVISVTPNHSVYGSDGNPADARENPDLLAIRKVEVGLGRNFREDLLKLLAAYVSCGFVSNGSISIFSEDGKLLREIAEMCDGAGFSYDLKQKSVEIRNSALSNLVKSLCGVVDKRIPDVVYGLKRRLREVFWEYMLRGRGIYEDWKSEQRVEFCTTSKNLAAGICFLLSTMNYPYSVDLEDCLFRVRVGFEGGGKRVLEYWYRGYVYDLEVEGSHNFAAGVGNVVAHNTHVDRSISNPESFLRSNVIGVFTILEAIRRRNPEARLIQISTDEVYGEIRSGSFSEESRLSPSSPYSASKAAADMFVMAYVRTYGLDAVITRCTNNYGPYQFPEKLIPKTIIRASMDLKIPVYGTGMNVRDWIYVLDHCEAIELVMEKGERGEIYNISSGEEKTNIEVVKTILSIMGKPEDLIEFVEDRPGHDFRYSLDSSKIRRELGWRPRHTFKEGIRETVRWYLENEEWWRKLVDDRILHPTPWKLRW